MKVYPRNGNDKEWFFEERRMASAAIDFVKALNLVPRYVSCAIPGCLFVIRQIGSSGFFYSPLLGHSIVTLNTGLSAVWPKRRE